MRGRGRTARAGPVLLLTCAAWSCAPEPERAEATGRPTTVEVWYHAGQPGERRTLERQVARFHELQDSIGVVLRFIPEGSYNAQVQASAVANRLPDLLDLDGPYVATYAWQGHLRPLEGLLPDRVLDDLIPSIRTQGTWRDALYAVGTFDSGLALYGNRRLLEDAGASIPTRPDEAWRAERLTTLLERLAERDPDGAVLDLKLNYEGEWFTYAFQPALRSGGGGLLDADGSPRARGVLDAGASARVMAVLQRWLLSGLVDPNLDDAAFTTGRVALSWSGHWDFGRYREALGDDLVVIPLPDFGEGTRTGQGSWVWTVPRGADEPEAAASLLSFLLEPRQVLEMTRENGAVPATRSAAAMSELYGPGGPLELLLVQLERWAVARPRTPAYPFASSVFQDAFDAVRNGEDVDAVLARAAATIDREIADNRGYSARASRR